MNTVCSRYCPSVWQDGWNLVLCLHSNPCNTLASCIFEVLPFPPHSSSMTMRFTLQKQLKPLALSPLHNFVHTKAMVQWRFILGKKELLAYLIVGGRVSCKLRVNLWETVSSGALRDLIWYDMIWCYVVRYDVIWYIVWYKKWCDTWCDTIYDVIKDTMWYDKIRCDVISWDDKI